MNKHTKFVAFVAALFLAACAQKSGVPTLPSTSQAPASVVMQSVVTSGNFTEYSIPAGVHPLDLVRGPYSTIYFTDQNAGTDSHLYQLTNSTGKIHVFTAPAPYQSAGDTGIVSLNRSVIYVVKIPINEDEFFFAHVTPEGVFTFTGAPYFGFGLGTNLALTPSGTAFVFGFCIDPCDAPDDGFVAGDGLPGTRLDDSFIPQALTSGPGGNYYVTATFFGPPPPTGTDSRVYVISQTGAILHEFALPVGSNPRGITVGSDHNLWIAEPGINKIARMTPAGVLTQFSLPTANAGPDRITGASAAALFFTESNADKIGRITTTGSITEYRVPTAAAQPTGIAPCTTACGTHGGAWFTETAGNKIGRFNSPI